MKDFKLSQAAWVALNGLIDNVSDIEKAYVFSNKEMKFMEDSFNDVAEKVKSIIDDHNTEKLDFEGMVNMVSGMYRKAANRSTDIKTEPLHWVNRRASAMAATVVELAIESIQEIKNNYHLDEVPKTKKMTKDGHTSILHYTWYRNYFACHGVKSNQEQAWLDGGDLPDGFTFEEGVIGSSKIRTKDGREYRYLHISKMY